MGIKEIASGAVITVMVGGTAYTANQADVVNNFANDTGMSQQQAEQYVTEVNKDELVPFEELGADLVKDGTDVIGLASDIDCVNYEYEWESPTLSCDDGKNQLHEIGSDTVTLGNAYKKLDSDSATSADISTTIERIDELNADYEFDIVDGFLDKATVDEITQSNSYNKAILKAALEQ